MTPTYEHNKRKQRFRRPYRECYSQFSSNSCSTKTLRNPFMHNTKHPNLDTRCQSLIRSKSAVIRNMKEKMPAPLTRSQTLNENLMRYYSRFNTSTLRAFEPGSNFHLSKNILPNNSENMMSTLERKFSKSEREYCMNPDSYDQNRIYELQTNSRNCGEKIPRRADGVEYNAISNIFSDDSLRTARKKVQAHFSTSGGHLATMEDHSKAYYDSNCHNEENLSKILCNKGNFNNLTNFCQTFRGIHDNESKNLEEHLYYSLENNQIIESCPCFFDISNRNDEHKELIDATISNLDDILYRRRINQDLFRHRKARSSDSYLRKLFDHKIWDENNMLSLSQLTNHFQQKALNEHRERSSSFSGRIESQLNDRNDRKYFIEKCKRRRYTTDNQSQLTNLIKEEKSGSEVPGFQEREHMKVKRAESKQKLIPDIEENDGVTKNAGIMSRRQRTTSCPEACDIRNIRKAELAYSFSGTNDTFGSAETVLCQEFRDKLKYQREFDSSWTVNTDDSRFKIRNTSCLQCRDRFDRSYSLLDDKFHKKSQRLEFEKEIVECEQKYQGGKRNVAISDRLEYYEYSMDSDSQCSDNCGFGLYVTSKTPDQTSIPGKANLNIFDSQTTTSDTAKYPRLNEYHNTTTLTSRKRDTNDNAEIHGDNDDENMDTIIEHMTDGFYDDNPNHRIDKQLWGTSEYTSPGGSYEKHTRHTVAGSRYNGHPKRSQFSRSLSSADVPPDEKSGELIQ